MLHPLHAPGRVVFTTTGIGPSWRRVAVATDAVSAARRFTAAQLDQCDPESVDAATLVTSELVTNAVQYALTHDAPPKKVEPGIWLGVLNGDRYIHLRVRDPFPQLPEARVAAETDLNGRGLAIVEMLAAVSWVDAGRYDKTVHAVITKPGVVLTKGEINSLRRS